jgi:hypothetical protein
MRLVGASLTRLAFVSAVGVAAVALGSGKWGIRRETVSPAHTPGAVEARRRVTRSGL